MAAFVFRRGQIKRRPTRSMAQAHLSRIGGTTVALAGSAAQVRSLQNRRKRWPDSPILRRECVRHSSDRGNPPDVLCRFCGAVALIPELTEAADRTDASASQPLPPRTYASAGRFPLEPAGASGFYSANMSGVACWMACRVCVSMIASGLVGSMPGRFRSYCSFIRCWKDAMA